MAEWELNGPTKLTIVQEPGWDVLDEEGWSIAFVYSERLAPGGHDYDGQATANLIKAAPKLLKVLRDLFNVDHIDLGDLVYHVRDNEMLGWDGPAVTAWGQAVADARKLMEELKP